MSEVSNTDSQSSDHPIRVTTRGDGRDDVVKASCCEIYSSMCSTCCADESEARRERHEMCIACLRSNECLGCLQFLGLMGLAILVIACVAGTVYLWAIPYLVKEILEKNDSFFERYSNAVALFMWPQVVVAQNGRSIWEPWNYWLNPSYINGECILSGGRRLETCISGATTFFAWLIHVFGIDAFLVGCIMLLLYFVTVDVRGQSYLTVNDNFCCPYVRTIGVNCDCNCRCYDLNENSCFQRSNLFFGLAVFCFSSAAFVGVILVSYYAGPPFAFAAFEQCKRYNNTIINFYGDKTCMVKTPVGFLSIGAQYGNQTVPGSQLDCQRCQDIGIGVLFTIISVSIALVWLTVLFIISTKRKYEAAKAVVVAKKKEQQNDFSVSWDSGAISMSE